MLNEEEGNFVKTFLAILSLDDCKTIDVDFGSINKIMKFLKIKMSEYGMFKTNESLIFLFLKDNNGIYHHLQKIIEGLDSSIVTYDEVNRKLNITLDEKLANATLNLHLFSEEDMFDLVQEMKPILGFDKKMKVK